MLLAGSKVLNGTGSADQVATRWAWILLGFCCFGCVPTRWKMHPGRREEVSAPPTQAFIGHHPVHAAVSHACSPATLAAVTCLWSGWRPTMLPRAVTSTQPMPAKASSPTHPPLLLAGSKVLNGTGSADQVATRWAPRCCPGPLRQPNQCLPKLPAPPIHLCF